MSDHSTLGCCHQGCGHVICFEPEVERRLRRSHESFSCPAGHTQHFSSKTAEQRRIEQLEDEVADVRRLWREAELESRRCPWPTCRTYPYADRRGLYEHMRNAHNMPRAVDLVAEADAS